MWYDARIRIFQGERFPMNQAPFVTLAEAAAAVPSGTKIAIGGAMVMSPMSFVREMIRREKRNLDLVAVPIGGINVDMLVGAGCVRSVEFPQISLGEFGMAPNFRRAVERGRIATHEHS
jgi:glutaconate CoA-transferase subunit A